MPDDLTKKRPLDASRIGLYEPWEITYWCKELGCTEQKLRKAVATVGTSAAAVREWVKKN